jgi:hypothetical protein
MSEKDKFDELDEIGLDDVIDEGEEDNSDILDADFAEVVEEPAHEVVPKTKAAPPASKDLFSFESLMSVPGVVIGEVGIEVSRFPVERAKFTTSSRSLISIVSPKVIVIKTHYNEDLGNYVCFGGKCCEVDGLAKVRYLFPVVIYDTDKRGLPVSKEVSFRVLSLGKDSYDDVRTIMELNGDISKMDLVVTCKDEQYQKVSLAQAGTARWRKDKDIARQVVSFWKEHMKDLIMPVARIISPEEYLKKLSEGAAIENTVADDVDFDKLFDD